MPSLRKGDYALQPGYFDQPLDFYTVNPALDAAGGVLDPSSIAVAPVHAYKMLGNVGPYQGLELRDALTKLGEQWATISIRWARSRLPVEGMRVVVKATGDEYEVTGVEHLSTLRRKVELTCRLIR